MTDHTWHIAGDADGNPTTTSCQHLTDDDHHPLAPPRLECPDCIREGSQWVHLRQCLSCGHVGCCDSSPRRHATHHWNQTRHPLVRSVQPGESWAWCYPDKLFLLPEEQP